MARRLDATAEVLSGLLLGTSDPLDPPPDVLLEVAVQVVDGAATVARWAAGEAQE